MCRRSRAAAKMPARQAASQSAATSCNNARKSHPALVIPGAGWLFLALLQLILVLWLAACLAGIFAAARLRRHIRRQWQSGESPCWHLGR